jgi:deoxyribonuclease-1
LRYSITGKAAVLFFTLTLTCTWAQNISIVKATEDFGSTDELNPVNRTIQVYNPQTYGISVSGVETFDLFGSRAFATSDTNLYLFPGDTLDIPVSFLPAHNVMHEIPLVVRTSTGFGHIFMWLRGQGTYSKTYYSTTQDKEGSALRSALNSRIATGYNSLGYTAARDNMYASIDNVNGDVECVYTGRTATFNTRAGANANSFNCEHTFPQGFFNQNEPMRSDIHHLFPTDVSANSQRGNDPFGSVSNANWSQGGSKSGGGKFEPRDMHKGAAARAMMYFVLRYQDYSNFFQGHQTILYNWHNSYPPTAAEKQRNSDIAALQNNRNPFVDYPQLMDRMKALVGSADLSDYDFYYSDDTISLARGSTGLSTYSFLVYNRGNQPISLFNFQLSDPNLSFSPFQVDTILLARGQMGEIQVNFDAGITYQNEFLSFSNNAGGINNFQIPISSDANFSLSENKAQAVTLYPNPALDQVTIQGLQLQSSTGVKAVDIYGRSYQLTRVGKNQLDISQLSPGIYFLMIKGVSRALKLVVNSH